MAQDKPKSRIKKLWEGWSFIGGIALFLYLFSLFIGRH